MYAISFPASLRYEPAQNYLSCQEVFSAQASSIFYGLYGPWMFNHIFSPSTRRNCPHSTYTNQLHWTPGPFWNCKHSKVMAFWLLATLRRPLRLVRLLCHLFGSMEVWGWHAQNPSGNPPHHTAIWCLSSDLLLKNCCQKTAQVNPLSKLPWRKASFGDWLCSCTDCVRHSVVSGEIGTEDPNATLASRDHGKLFTAMAGQTTAFRCCRKGKLKMFLPKALRGSFESHCLSFTNRKGISCEKRMCIVESWPVSLLR